jgi:hypothetical protein
MTKQTFRPNAVPANYKSVKERVVDLVGRGSRRSSGKLRSVVTDLCDFCLKIIHIRRRFLSLRIRGWKFICRDCLKDRGIDLNGKVCNRYIKQEKLFIEYIVPKQNQYEVEKS